MEERGADDGGRPRSPRRPLGRDRSPRQRFPRWPHLWPRRGKVWPDPWRIRSQTLPGDVYFLANLSGAYHRLSCYIISAVYFGSFFILFVKSLRDLATSSRLITFILGTLHSRCYRTSYVRTAPSAQVSPSPPVQKYSPLSPNSHTRHCSLLPTSARLSADPPLHPSLLRESLKSNHRAGSCCCSGEAIIRSS